MPTYEFWYDETTTYKAWFDAENLEKAELLIEQVKDGEISLDDLPNFGNKDKGYETNLDYSTLEEI